MEKSNVKVVRQCNFIKFTNAINCTYNSEIPILYLRYDRIISVYEEKKYKPDFDKTAYYQYFVETIDGKKYIINYNDYCKFEKHFNPEFNI